MVLVTIFICIPFVIREVVPVLEELGTGRGGRRPDARRVGLADLLPGDPAEHPVGAAVRDRAVRRARHRRDRRRAHRERRDPGQTETATLYIFRAFEERQTAEAYVVALTLAAISVVLLVAIEVLTPSQEAERTPQ